MQTISASDLRTRIAEVLDLVERGEEIAIERHGKTVAQLVPPRARKPRIDTPLMRQIDALLERKPAGQLDIDALPVGNAEESIKLLEEGRRVWDEE
jgi:prevent-host-death family protein